MTKTIQEEKCLKLIEDVERLKSARRFFDKIKEVDGHYLYPIKDPKSGKHGIARFDGGTAGCHTLYWLLTGHSVPPGHFLQNTCGNESCINPAHLETKSYSKHFKEIRKSKYKTKEEFRAARRAAGRKYHKKLRENKIREKKGLPLLPVKKYNKHKI